MLGSLITIIFRGHLFDLILVRGDLIVEVQVVSNFDIKIQCTETMGVKGICSWLNCGFVRVYSCSLVFVVFLKCKSGINKGPTVRWPLAKLKKSSTSLYRISRRFFIEVSYYGWKCTKDRLKHLSMHSICHYKFPLSAMLSAFWSAPADKLNLLFRIQEIEKYVTFMSHSRFQPFKFSKKIPIGQSKWLIFRIFQNLCYERISVAIYRFGPRTIQSFEHKQSIVEKE